VEDADYEEKLREWQERTLANAEAANERRRRAGLPQLPPPDVEPGWLERSEPRQVGLDNNLALLAASARYFDEEGLADASDETVRFQRPRQLFATISLERRVLSDEGFMAELLETYIAAAPGIYGYWVQVANLGSTPRPADVRRLSDFLYELERRTDKPVVPERLDKLGLGYLEGGLAGYCIGTRGDHKYSRLHLFLLGV
jgi:hypothetical protein